MKKNINKAVAAADAVGDRVREKVIGYLLAGLGLVSGLAWNEAIKAAIDALIPTEADSLVAKFIYAFTVTLLVVVVTFVLVFLTKQTESEMKKKK